jgi:4-amino-4-deoxy-L-arabinose transferase-like glycosyltransferase
LALGEIKIPSPPEADEFVIPFVIDYQGQRFSKYPLGWPMMLSFGVRLDLMRSVNPLLAGLAVWLIFRLGQRLLGDRVGLMAAGLTVVSPLFLTYSGSILSHTWGLVLSLSLAVAWLDLTSERTNIPGWLPTLVAGLSLGCLALSRPWSAFGIAIPFGVHGLILLRRGTPIIRKRILTVGVIALLITGLYFLWQYALTGDPWQNPYLLWWPYDKIGFGEGFGIADGGHSLRQGWIHTKNSLRKTWQDLWGWGGYSWLLLLPGLWAVRRRPRVWLIGSVFPSLVGVYLFYWVSGPRYFYEGLYSLTILSAAGIAWLAGWMPSQMIKIPPQNLRLRQAVVLVGLIALLIFGTWPYTPIRLHEIKDRYGFSRVDLEPFLTPEAQELTPALIIVHATDWWDYGVYLNLQDPRLKTPFIFTWASASEDLGPQLAHIAQDRTIYYYYPDEPGEFYVLPRP